MNGPCEHAALVRHVKPMTPEGCTDCLKIGSGWVHLRLCLECGYVGCCDSSPNKHMTKHFHHVHHPVVRSFEPGEHWKYCYVDELMWE